LFGGGSRSRRGRGHCRENSRGALRLYRGAAHHEVLLASAARAGSWTRCGTRAAPEGGIECMAASFDRKSAGQAPAPQPGTESAEAAAEKVFREESGRIVAALIR